MDETEIKTRLGYILQNVFAEALSRMGLQFSMDVQYDSLCERPDFLVPNEKDPSFLIEVHQTEARNSFQMKALRAFTAVVEGKAHFGDGVVSVNFLFGSPDESLPRANVEAMGSIFDSFVVTSRTEGGAAQSIREIEKLALSLAAVEGKTTKQCSDQICGEASGAIDVLAELIAKVLASAPLRAELSPLWAMERARVLQLAAPNTAGEASYYKRTMLRALFFSDEAFDELLASPERSDWSESTKDQLIRTGSASLVEEIDGDTYELEASFHAFLRSERARELRDLCRECLRRTPEMHWFFEDIREAHRRNAMAAAFIAALNAGRGRFERLFRESFERGSAGGIEHARCWVADLMPILLGRSHNFFNRRMYSSSGYTSRLGNPFNNIAIRSARLGADPDLRKMYARIALEVFYDQLDAAEIDLADLEPDPLADLLLAFRVSAAIKLRKLDPLMLVSQQICHELNLSLEPIEVPSLVSDLCDGSAAGRFRAWCIAGKGDMRVLINFVAVHDGNGDHKSKEWGARRLASLYRWWGGEFRSSEFADSIFLLDGEWSQKDVARLYRHGWSRICRLDGLRDQIREAFRVIH